VALLGEGTYGQVFLVEDINTGNQYAMKKLDKREIEEQNMMRYTQTERNILTKIDHPFIVKLFYAF
jgi:protein-serine/threonine kinase